MAKCKPFWRRASPPGAALISDINAADTVMSPASIEPRGVPQMSVEVTLAVALSDAIYSAHVLSASLLLAVTPELHTCCAPVQDYGLQVVCHMAGSQQAFLL